MRVLSNGYTLRKVGLDCISSLANLHKSAFQRGWGAHDFALFLQDKHMRLTGAFPSKRHDPAGFLLLRVVADEAEVISLAVSRRHRRKGLGAGLMDMAIDELYDEGVKTLHLEVDEKNRAAVRLYEQLGFDIVGERKAYYPSDKGSAGNNALIMQLAIADE
ncbi:MAG: acetyltransferase [Rhodomicrobium sp.]|nr:MAG: acetyltransferase [Rhodomicrobium sp.]